MAFQTGLTKKSVPIIIKFDPQQQVLLLLFGGLAQKIGIPFFEFNKITSGLNRVNKIFLRDKYRFWYHRGLPRVGRDIDAVASFLQQYTAHPSTHKIIAVGNEAMVDWQTHFVPASAILKWVNVLREARTDGKIPAATLITTSDNWAALGGEERYRSEYLAELMRQIDYVSLHTYAFHDTYYNPKLQWGPLPEEMERPVIEQISNSVESAIVHQKKQYEAVKNYLRELGVDKKIHIGETGWASLDNSHYGKNGTCAAGEYTQKLFYDAVMEWTRENDLTCFYFEAFDEPWKSEGTAGSEGHFGLFTVDGQAKYALWNLVDAGLFEGLSRGGNPVTKTHAGDLTVLKKKLSAPRHIKN